MLLPLNHVSIEYYCSPVRVPSSTLIFWFRPGETTCETIIPLLKQVDSGRQLPENHVRLVLEVHTCKNNKQTHKHICTLNSAFFKLILH